MSKLIIIEGIDGVGKTELAGQLYIHGKTPFALLHAGPPGEDLDAEETYFAPIWAMAHQGYTVVCDRWHLGEMVWPYVFHRECLIGDTDTLSDLESDLLDAFDDVTCIYLHRDREDIQRIREINYDYHRAINCYNDAIGMSSFSWWVGSLTDFLPGGENDRVLFADVLDAG